jgi:hypothetical protein
LTELQAQMRWFENVGVPSLFFETYHWQGSLLNRESNTGKIFLPWAAPITEYLTLDFQMQEPRAHDIRRLGCPLDCRNPRRNPSWYLSWFWTICSTILCMKIIFLESLLRTQSRVMHSCFPLALGRS